MQAPSCHEGLAFLGGIGGHLIIDLILLPLAGYFGWRFHSHNHNPCTPAEKERENS